MARTNYAVDIATMKKDIEYIKKAINENTEQHNQIIKMIQEEFETIQEKKVDQSEFDVFRRDYINFKNKVVWGLITGLFAIIAFFIRKIIEFAMR